MIWPLSILKRRPLPAPSELPEEVVLLVRDMRVVYRRGRPLGWIFGPAPHFLDDADTLRKVLARNYPELTDMQIERAIVMIERRVKAILRDRAEDPFSMGRRRRGAWMEETEMMNRSPIEWEEE